MDKSVLLPGDNKKEWIISTANNLDKPSENSAWWGKGQSQMIMYSVKHVYNFSEMKKIDE